MKRTGPTKERTKKLVALLEKHGRKSKTGIWIELAARLSKPSRQRAKVNVWKLEKLARIFKGKTLVVPGKVLANGFISEKAKVAAFEYSPSAKEKIEKAGGQALSLEEAVEKKAKASEMVIVK